MMPPGGIAAHLGLVHRTVNRYRWAIGKGGITEADLTQAGSLGLMRAAQDWAPERAKWSTYAVNWVRHYVGRYVQNHAHVVRVPVHRQERSAKRGEPIAQRCISLDWPASGCDAESPLGDCVSYPFGEDPFAAPDAAVDVPAVHEALAQLDERHRRVLVLRIWGERTLREIGEELDGLSRERIRQLELEALDSLRHLLRGPRRRSPRAA